MEKIRGSEKLLSAWKQRILTEESVQEVAQALSESPAVVEDVKFVGGDRATGVSLSLSYSAEDIPRCGNDILNLLGWNRKFGGKVRIPNIFVNGTPALDNIRLQVELGDVSTADLRADDLQQLNGIERIRGR